MVFTLQYNRWIGKGQFFLPLYSFSFLLSAHSECLLYEGGLSTSCLPGPSILPQDMYSVSPFVRFLLFSSQFLSSIPIATHFCLWPYTASSPLSIFFSSSLATFSFFHFKPEGKWSVTSVAGTRTSPVARLGPAPAQETAKSPSQGRIFTSSQSSSSPLRSWAKSNLAIDQSSVFLFLLWESVASFCEVPILSGGWGG